MSETTSDGYFFPSSKRFRVDEDVLTVNGSGTYDGQWVRKSAYDRLKDSDRHPKWTPVEPGTVIPAGQPYQTRNEDVSPVDYKIPTDTPDDWFVDSSWKPPLVLPTEPTWGIVVKSNGYKDALKVWRDDPDGVRYENNDLKGWMKDSQILDFIPLAPEQVARIEAAR